MITKALPGRPQQGKLPAHQTGAQPVHCILWKGLQSRTWALLAGHAFIHFCLPSFDIFAFPGFFIWVFWQRSSSGTSAKGPLWEEEGKSLKILFFHSDSVLSAFLLLTFFPYPQMPSRVQKTTRDLGWGGPSTK